jgi:hypothetical protein
LYIVCILTDSQLETERFIVEHSKKHNRKPQSSRGNNRRNDGKPQSSRGHHNNRKPQSSRGGRGQTCETLQMNTFQEYVLEVISPNGDKAYIGWGPFGQFATSKVYNTAFRNKLRDPNMRVETRKLEKGQMIRLELPGAVVTFTVNGDGSLKAEGKRR